MISARTIKKPHAAPQTARITKAEADMRAKLGSYPEGSTRHRVLATAIDFKRSWIELAAHLSMVQRTAKFKEWGFRTYEAYAQSELHLRRETAAKLARAHHFLEANEPNLLDARMKRPLPQFEAIDALAMAREDQHLSEADYRELRDRVFGEDLTPGQVKKLFRDKVPAPTKAADPEADLKRSLQLSERLYGLLIEQVDMPADITKHAEAIVQRLRRMLEG